MKDGVFFLGIFVLLFVVWVASGGPSRPISFAGPYLNPIHTTGTSAQPYGDPSKFSSINSTVTVGVGGITATPNTSASSGGVTLSRDTSGAMSTDPENEYLIINVSAGAKTAISTAGWKLVSKETGVGASFPQGAEVARSGRVNALSAITLRPGDQAIVTTGRSPVGISFRESICTGYFEEHQDFHPALSLSCPTPSQELSHFYDTDSNSSCAEYVRSIPYCGTETRSDTDTSSSCRSFVEDHLNYNGCVDAHGKDEGFLSGTWRIFLGKSDDLWRNRKETILLLDAENKVIDSLSY